MSITVDKPILTSKGQAARLKRLEESLKERERELEQRKRELEIRERAVSEREQALIQLEQAPVKKPASPKKRPKPTISEKRLVFADLETSTSPAVPEAKAPNLPEAVSVPTATPRQVSRPTQPSTTSSAKTETVFALPLTFNAPEFSGFSPIPTSPTTRTNLFTLEPEPLKTIANISSVPPFPIVASPANPSPAPDSSSPKKGKKQKKKEISPFKNPLQYLIANRRTISIGLAVTMFNTGIAGYFAYLGRDVVATRIAEQTNALQRKNLALQTAQLDPFRKLRDRLIEEDPCRSGHAYRLITKKYQTFVEQTPSRQLEVLALDPKIRANINIIAEGGTPPRGVCNLFR